MIKKFIYSTIALSFAMMPVSTTLAANIEQNMTINSGGSFTINSTDTWGIDATSGKYATVDNQGGTFTLNGFSKDYAAEYTAGTMGLPNYKQNNVNGGNLVLQNGASLSLYGSSAGAAEITYGTVQIGYDGSTGSTLTLQTGSRLGESAGFYLGEGNTIRVGGNASGEPSLYVSENDSWNGSIEMREAGSAGAVMQIDGLTKAKSGTLTADTGVIHIVNGSNFDLNNTGDYLEAGTLHIGSDTSTNNTLTISAQSAAKTYTLGADELVRIHEGNTLAIKNNGSAILNNDGDNWSGNVEVSGGTLTLDGRSDVTTSTKTYKQTGGTLNLGESAASSLSLATTASSITGGTVNLDKGSTLALSNGLTNTAEIVTKNDAATPNTLTLTQYNTDTPTKLVMSAGTDFAKEANLNVNTNTTLELAAATQTPAKDGAKVTMNYGDVWDGTVKNSGGTLTLSNYADHRDDGDPSFDPSTITSIYQQSSGNLNFDSTTSSQLVINTTDSYINGGKLNMPGTNVLYLNTTTNNQDAGAMLGEATSVSLGENSYIFLTGNGDAILNDIGGDVIDDVWDGTVMILDDGTNNPTLTLKNVTKDFTDAAHTGILAQGGGTLNIYANDNGGSHLTYWEKDETGTPPYVDGKINIQGNALDTSSLTIRYAEDSDGLVPVIQNTQMQGDARLVLEADGHTLNHTEVPAAATGTNNALVVNNATYNLNRPNATTTMSNYGLDLNKTTMTSNTPLLNVGGSMAMYDSMFRMPRANSHTNVFGNLTTSNSSINMMNGAINAINVAGNTNINGGLNMRVDFDPASGLADSINSRGVVANNNSVLNLADFNLLSEPTKKTHTFRVVNAANENYLISPTALKTVTANKIVETNVGYYRVMPSAVKGAFDLTMYKFKPEIYRGQVMESVIYANQLAITNQLFDRMFYSNLPYFNGECSNKTAAANTLFSPYQYTTNDTGLWFKPYGNFETISMTEGLDVKNNAYGALIGVDFPKKNMRHGWSFIPTAYIGYNGGYSSYDNVSMWHNGGQGGFMGTFTRKDFITSFVGYAGGYHNAGPYNESNALWNAGVASKTAYNIHLPWHFILQPTVYLAYNYVGASDIDSNSGTFIKIHPLNAFNVAPGVNLIWQRETFSIYAMFQAMFNINGRADASVNGFDVPFIGMRDPYFEYGLGFSKYFKERFSGYAQATARSGSRKGIGFQLGFNMKI